MTSQFSADMSSVSLLDLIASIMVMSPAIIVSTVNAHAYTHSWKGAIGDFVVDLLDVKLLK